MSDIINFYTIPKVKKHLSKFKDEQEKYTGMPLGKHILFCGSTGSGKSNALLNYIYLTSKPKDGTFSKIFFVYKTWEPLYKFLKDELKDNIEFCLGLSQCPKVDSFSDSSDKNQTQYLVIFDDCINDTSKMDLKIIKDYFTYGRKKNISICYLSQSFYQTDIFIRKQMSFLILNGITGKKDLTSILKDYSIGDVDIKKLYDMYQYCKEDEFSFLKICCYQCKKDKKFSKNFTQYLNPEDF